MDTLTKTRNNNSSNNKNKRVCQYGIDCYRKNPIHLDEFYHPHLENILLNCYDETTGDYKLPDDCFAIQSIIKDQLLIMEKLYPDLSKRNKKNINPSLTASTSKLPDIKVTKSEDMLNLETSNEVKNKDLKRRRSKTPENHKPNQPSTSSASSSNENTEKLSRNIHDYFKVVLPRGQMLKKLENAAPYNFFLTTITDSNPTHKESLSITFQELLDSSLGDLESSVQINFMVDIGFLLGQYYFAGHDSKPLLILYGDETSDIKNINAKKPNVHSIKIQMSTPFATHHTKMSLFGYKDGSMRVVVSTANLYDDDWYNRTQGVWVSPTLPQLPEKANTTDGESPTGFRNDLLRYLIHYNIGKLQPWIARIRKTDFSKINVFLVASVPGSHRDTPTGPNWGHPRLGYLLGKHSAPISDACPIVAQSSSIGSLGATSQVWLQAEFTNSLRKDSSPIGLRKIPPIKMIYPSFSNVLNSHDGILGGGCLPYGKSTNDKQPWLKDHLHQWRCDCRYRSKAMPHIKSYCRWSKNGLYWMCLTSANLSKAAWGIYNKSAKFEPPLRMNNYEAGVLFLPKFINGKDVFPMEDKLTNNDKKFPMPYDIPLVGYNSDDSPFLCDFLEGY